MEAARPAAVTRRRRTGAKHAALGDDRVDQSAGVTSKAGLCTGDAAGAVGRPPAWRSSSAGRSSIAIRPPSASTGSTVDGGRGHAERDAVVPGQDGQRVRADLVGGVAVGGDAVGAGDDQVDLAALHDAPAATSRDEPVRDALPGHLPRGEPGTLHQRARLVDPHQRTRPARGRRGSRPGPCHSLQWRGRRHCSG